jgi:hypothetical protein
MAQLREKVPSVQDGVKCAKLKCGASRCEHAPWLLRLVLLCTWVVGLSWSILLEGGLLMEGMTREANSDFLPQIASSPALSRDALGADSGFHGRGAPCHRQTQTHGCYRSFGDGHAVLHPQSPPETVHRLLPRSLAEVVPRWGDRGRSRSHGFASPVAVAPLPPIPTAPHARHSHGTAPILAQTRCVYGDGGRHGHSGYVAAFGFFRVRPGPGEGVHPQALRLFWHVRRRSAWLPVLFVWTNALVDSCLGGICSALAELWRGPLLPLSIVSLSGGSWGGLPAAATVAGLAVSGRHLPPARCRILSAGMAVLVCPWGGGSLGFLALWAFCDPSFPDRAESTTNAVEAYSAQGGALDDVPISVRRTFVQFDSPCSQRGLRRVATDPSDHGSPNLVGAFQGLSVAAASASTDGPLAEGRRVRSRNERCYCPVPGCPAADPLRTPGRQSASTMRPHMEEHAGGRLAGDIPQQWLDEQGLIHCSVCSKLIALK